MKHIFILFLILLASCSTVQPEKTKTIEYKYSFKGQNMDEKLRNELLRNSKYSLGVIGEVEPIYIKGMESVFSARIDTGAENSSIDANNIVEFERDGQKWVSFEIINRQTGEIKKFTKKIISKTSIKRQESEDEVRIKVIIDISIGNENLQREFSLANREKFDYQVLIGRNVLNGLAIVDVSLKNSLN